MTMKRRLSPLALAGVALLLATASPASAQAVQSTVLLHELTESGACHVTSESFSNYRLTVKEGQHVVLDVRAPANNTAAYSLNVEGVEGQSDIIGPGDSTTFEFDVESAGSKAIRCEPGGRPDLQGLLIVRAADAGGDGGGDASTPAPGALLSLGAAVAVGLIARRAHRRGDA